MDLEFREDRILTIPEKVTLRNKKRISLLAKGSQLINKGSIVNLNELFVRNQDKLKENIFTKNYIGSRQAASANKGSLVTTSIGSYSGVLQISVPVQPTWPTITQLITTANTNSTFTTNFSESNSGLNNGSNYITYTATYSFTQTGPGTNNGAESSISFNSSSLPSNCSYSINIISIGAGGAGGGSFISNLNLGMDKDNVYSIGNVYNLGQVGYSGSIFNSKDGNQINSTTTVTDNLTFNTNVEKTINIGFTNGIGGSPATLPSDDFSVNQYPSPYDGNSGGDTSATVLDSTTPIYTQTAPGGSGGYSFSSGIGNSNNVNTSYPSYEIITPGSNSNTIITLSSNSLAPNSYPTQMGGYCPENNPAVALVNGSTVTVNEITIMGGGGGTNTNENGENVTNTPIEGGLTPLPLNGDNPLVGYGCGGGGAGILSSNSYGTTNVGLAGGDGYTAITITCSVTEVGVNPNHITPF